MSEIGVSVFFSAMLFVIRWAHEECARMAGERPDPCVVATLGFVAWACLAAAATIGILWLVGAPYPGSFGALTVALCYGIYGFRRDKRWIQRGLSTLKEVGE